MKKTVYMIIVILLAVMIAMPCFAESVDWITDKSSTDIMKNLIDTDWRANLIPLFSENEMKPLIDPLTNTIYALFSVSVKFNMDNTVITTNVYYPAHQLAYERNNIRCPSLKDIQNKKIVEVDLTYEGEPLHWGVSSKGYLVIFTENEDGTATYRYIYKMSSNNTNLLVLTDYYTNDRTKLTRTSN